MQVDSLLANCAQHADLAALSALVESKADKALLDQVSAGRSSALAALEGSVQQLQHGLDAVQQSVSACARAADLAALQQVVATKADGTTADELGAAQRDALMQLAALGQSLDTLQACMAALQDACLTQTALDTFREELASKADKSELDSVSGGSAGALADVQTAIAGLQERMQQMATSTDLAEAVQQCNAAAASASEQLKAVSDAMSSKPDRSELQQLSNVATVAARLEQTVHDLQERIAQLPGTDAMQHVEERLDGKASSAQAQELAEAVQAMQAKLQGVSGSEQMDKVQQRLDQLAADVAARGAATASSAAVEELHAQLQQVEQLAQAAASQSALDAVNVCCCTACFLHYRPAAAQGCRARLHATSRPASCVSHDVFAEATQKSEMHNKS